ncbi:MAG: hypothetical protein R3F33_03940 [Planctomycetota bacterium]
MIAILYRWRLLEGREAEFAAAWAEVTDALVARGGGGSALFSCEDGTHWGIARWVDLDHRKTAFDGPSLPASAVMRDCIAERFPEILLTELDNRWA